MRGRRFLVTWWEADTAEALKGAYQGEGDLEFRRRLHGLWLLRCGWGLLSVAQAVGIHYRTVQRWAGWYREGGVGNVLSHKMGGKGCEGAPAPPTGLPVAISVSGGRWPEGSASLDLDRLDEG